MLSNGVSKRRLSEAKLTLEQVESTDSVLVSNLSPAHTEDVLELYFGSNRGGGGDVLGVSMLANGRAKVSFKDVKCKPRSLSLTSLLESLIYSSESQLSFVFHSCGLHSPKIP